MMNQSTYGSHTPESVHHSHLAATIHSIAIEQILLIVRFGISGQPWSIQHYIKVCRRWRSAIFGDRVLCAEVALEFKSIKPILAFLMLAGDFCQALDFDKVLTHDYLSPTQRRVVARFLLNSSNRLRNSTSIKNIVPLPMANWSRRLREATILPHLRSLQVHLSETDPLPEFSAPNLTSIDLVAKKPLFVPPQKLAQFIQHFVSLRDLRLQNIGCPTSLIGNEHLIRVKSPHLRRLVLKSILPAQYRIMLRLLGDTQFLETFSLALVDPLPLEEIRSMLDIRNNSKLHITLCPFPGGVRLIIYNSASRPLQSGSYQLDASFPFRAHAGYVDKTYYRVMPDGLDLIQEMKFYAQYTETISLTAIHSHSHALCPSSQDVELLKLVTWLRSLEQPRKLTIDTSLRPIFQLDLGFLCNSAEYISLACRLHEETTIDDDNRAIQSLTQWVQDQDPHHRITVELTGRKWQRDVLPLDKLQHACFALYDNRTH